MSYKKEYNSRPRPDVWGPHYWFFLHTIAHYYPTHPTATMKRKHYDLIHNFPIFIPDEHMGDEFAKLLDKYPVTPYLDCRESFMRWVHFIHNKINATLGKDEISLFQSLDKYNDQFLPKMVLLDANISLKQHIIHLVFILLCILVIYCLV